MLPLAHLTISEAIHFTFTVRNRYLLKGKDTGRTKLNVPSSQCFHLCTERWQNKQDNLHPPYYNVWLFAKKDVCSLHQRYPEAPLGNQS